MRCLIRQIALAPDAIDFISACLIEPFIFRMSGSGRNRKAAVVAKRWALWKSQRAQGYTVEQIAKAWGCNHSSISNAERHKFQAGYSGRPRK